MRRYSILSTVVIVILLLALAGSWTWFLTFGEDDSPALVAPRVTSPAGDQDPTTAKNSGAGAAPDGEPREDSDGRSRHNEPERDADGADSEPHRQSQAPESVETGTRAESDEAEPAGDEIVVEWKALDPGVVDSDGEAEGLDTFVVSTLEAPESRRRMTQWHGGQLAFRDDKLGVIPRRKLRSVQRPIPPPVITHVLRGKLVYPELDESQQQALKEHHRLQVTMYTPELSMLREIVDDSGEFVVPLTDAMARNYTRRGQRVYVHSPAFRLKSGKDYVDFRKDRSDFEIELELTPPLQVVVHVAPEKSIREEIRVWVERLGDPRGADFDDSLFMSARVPASGRLHFFVPARYGELRVAATGRNWHSGHPQTWNLERVTSDTLRISLNVVQEPCDLVTGRIQSEESKALGAARLVSTHYGVTAYTDGSGEFSIYVPFEPVRAHRQLIATRAHRRPEVLPLETRSGRTPGVTGDKPTGPFEVTLAHRAEVELRFPETLERTVSVSAGGRLLEREDRGVSHKHWSTKIVWGATTLFANRDSRPPQPGYYIDEEEWAGALQQYADGVERPVIRVKRLDEELKRRG